MAELSRFSLALHALRELGVAPVACYALYQAGLRTGFYRRYPTPPPHDTPFSFHPLSGEGKSLSLYPSTALASIPSTSPQSVSILSQADEICTGQVRLFGAEPVPLELTPSGPLVHWSEYERGKARPAGQADIKFTWEPARFGWAFILGQAYLLSGKQDYAQYFWDGAETFLSANPPYLGPHWISAQEVALRLMALVYAGQVFAASAHTTPQRQSRLAEAIACHAHRIPPTLVYARAQNNNHLLSEAAGLYTAGLALADHPEAHRWRELGWKWFNWALQRQVTADGAYTQHSTNYHRLMLQLALWVDAIKERPFPPASRQRLAAAAVWLETLLDPASGQVPNLGANDGAYIIPLGGAFEDYRGAAAQAIQAFTGGGIGQSGNEAIRPSGSKSVHPASLIHHPSLPSWATIRAAHFTGRPSHADQLHIDLWWQGHNLALDAGTFQYSAPPPWDNALAGTAVHNTVMVDGQDQMTRAGRFLWLDYAQAEIIGGRRAPDGQPLRVDARHTGYLHLGAQHWRSLSATEEGWRVTDEILPWDVKGITGQHSVRLHWLLPDWPWKVLGSTLTLESPKGPVQLSVSGGDSLTLIRAGQVLAGPGPVEPTWGWRSPTYGVKLPALALVVEKTDRLPVTLVSEWNLSIFKEGDSR